MLPQKTAGSTLLGTAQLEPASLDSPAQNTAELNTALTTLPENEWRQRAAAHKKRAANFTKAHLERRAKGQKHAIEDFLFTYYSYKPANLAKWHPGAGVLLEGATEQATWRYYTHTPGGLTVDLPQFFAVRKETVAYIKDLLTRTLTRTPNFGCFGLHEWAMVYKLTPGRLRHSALPLRLGHELSDKVVENHRITCTHFDAYRFFTQPAEPLNTLTPTRETQADFEQAACLHAGMDVYKWATKLGPIIPGELLLDCFELARDIRYVDMQASPYDVSSYGLSAIKIETAAGKREYMQLQQGFADRGNQLRHRVLAAISHAEAVYAGGA